MGIAPIGYRLSMGGAPLHEYERVRLIYLDESGVSDTPDSPWVLVAGTIIEPDAYYRALEFRLWQLAARYIPQGDMETTFKGFHAKELFNGSGKIFKDWPIERTLPIINGIIRTILRYDLPVIYGCCPKAHYGDQNPRPRHMRDNQEAAHVNAFCQAIMRANAWMRKNARANEMAMVVVEDKDKMRSRIRDMQISLRAPSVESIVDFQGQLPLERIIESVLFQTKGESFVLPLADMCAYILNRKICNRRIDGLFEWLAPQIAVPIKFEQDAVYEALLKTPRFKCFWGYPSWQRA